MRKALKNVKPATGEYLNKTMEIAKIARAHGADINCSCISYSGVIATGSGDHKVKLWTLDGNQKVLSELLLDSPLTTTGDLLVGAFKKDHTKLKSRLGLMIIW